MRILLLSICLFCGLSARAQTASSGAAEPPVQQQTPAEGKSDEGTPESEKPKDKEPLSENMPEVMPTFEGGDTASFHRWVMLRLRYPREAMSKGIQGRVLVEFIVEKDGTVGDVEIVRSPDPRLSVEVIRIFCGPIPAWTPGMNKGVPVRVKFTLPIDFRLQ